MNEKTAALVILYRYDEPCIENIKSYAGWVEQVIAFDNTEIERKDKVLENKLLEIKNLVLMDGKGNQGLSYAINQAAKYCIKRKFKWMFTFDQDSYADENMVLTMRTFAGKFDNLDEIGIISPLIKESEIKYSQPVYPFSYVDWVIQSGAMHNLDILKKVHGYDQNIFIHQADTEYCYRLMNMGYKIIRLNDAVLIHNVEDDGVKLKYLNGKKYYTNKFSPARYYYIVRNNLYCLKRYGKKNKLFGADLRNNTKILLKTWLLEEEKAERFRAVCLGVLDFLLGRMGKARWKF